MMKPRTFAVVWEAIEDSLEAAANMTLRSEVMAMLSETVRGWGTTRALAARRLGITQPRLNDLLQGKINKFPLDELLTLAARAGLRATTELRRAT